MPLDRVQFEMLEGMANHQRRALFELTGNMLLYAPACQQEDFTNAIGYLVRRLDENTGPDNFLRHAFNIEVGSDDWKKLEQQFIESYRIDAVRQQRATPHPKPKCHQLRSSNSRLPPWAADSSATNPTPIGPSRKTAAGPNSIIETWQITMRCPSRRSPTRHRRRRNHRRQRQLRDSLDPSRPGTVVARYRQATEADIDRAVACR